MDLIQKGHDVNKRITKFGFPVRIHFVFIYFSGKSVYRESSNFELQNDFAWFFKAFSTLPVSQAFKKLWLLSYFRHLFKAQNHHQALLFRDLMWSNIFCIWNLTKIFSHFILLWQTAQKNPQLYWSKMVLIHG